jgi:hypothetical protein
MNSSKGENYGGESDGDGGGDIEGVAMMHVETRAGILKKSMGARHRVGIGLSYRPARLHRLAELMP